MQLIFYKIIQLKPHLFRKSNRYGFYVHKLIFYLFVTFTNVKNTLFLTRFAYHLL